MNARTPREYLLQMLDATRLACSYVEGMDAEAFLDDARTQQAIVLNLVVIGEAATRLLRDHPGLAGRHPDIPWNSMKGMRNRIAHGYFDIDMTIVWETVRINLPSLAKQLESLVAED